METTCQISTSSLVHGSEKKFLWVWLPSLLADMKFSPPIIPCQNFLNELDLRFFVPMIVCETSCSIGTLVIGTDPSTYLANSVSLCACVH